MIDSTTAKPLHFNKNGKLRILHITDTHLNNRNQERTLYLIANACDKEKPNVVIITGDIAMSDCLSDTKRNIDRLMNVFQSRNIPVAICFGNHDSESGNITRQELMAYFNNYSCSISVDEGDCLPGCGTYNIPVLSYDSDAVKFNLWIFDSGDYDSEHHYSNTPAECVEWYERKSDLLVKENCCKVNSLAFQHMIVPEIYEALKRVKLPKPYAYKRIYFKNERYVFDSRQKNYGLYHETPCCGYYNHGQFDAMVKHGDVLAVFSGHDHTNAFGVRYRGIDIVNSLSTRYENDRFSSQYGYRVIDIDERNTAVYSTRVERWYNQFTLFDLSRLKSSGDKTGYELAKSLLKGGTAEKIIEKTGHGIVRLFGRKVIYPD